MKSAKPEDIEAEIAERIVEEFAAVNAYLSTWRSSGGFLDESQLTVKEAIAKGVDHVVKPWPPISQEPVAERQDGRLAKSFPLQFPCGEADIHQPRLRSDFSTADYVQHKFRYFDGRFWSTAQGQRVAWALFNTALREESYGIGKLVHRRSGEHALTKAELRDLVDQREDLVRQVSAFGADIPTTPMFWKKEGNHLEWIVRQMSWNPPWCYDP